MPNNKKVKRINVNLTEQDKKELEKIKYKYELSYSTIARILITYIGCYVPDNKYLFKDENEKKTSLKPRYSYSKIQLTNSIKLFVRNKLKHYIIDNGNGNTEEKQKLYDKLMNKIYKQFEIEKDPNWNGNELQRRMPKLIKQNKEYYKKLLGIEE